MYLHDKLNMYYSGRSANITDLKVSYDIIKTKYNDSIILTGIEDRFLFNPNFTVDDLELQLKIMKDRKYPQEKLDNMQNMIEFCKLNPDVKIINSYFITLMITDISNFTKNSPTYNIFIQQYKNTLEKMYQIAIKDIAMSFEKPVYNLVINQNGLQHTNLLVLYKGNFYSYDVVPEHKITEKTNPNYAELFNYTDSANILCGKNHAKRSVLELNFVQNKIEAYKDAIKDENAISFFDYIKTKHPEFKDNIYYNVGEIYVKGETCMQKTTDVIKIMKDSFKKDPKGFEMLLMSGMKKYGEKVDLSERNTKVNTNYFMASVSDFEEHKNVVLLQSLEAITNLNKLIQENLELKELFGKVGK